MVTRKAIISAFEMIVNDPKVRYVMYFCFKDGQAVDTVTAVRILRSDKEHPTKYGVHLGLLGKAEVEWFAKKTTKDGLSPKFYIDYFSGRR